MTRKILCLILALCMLLPIAVMAEGETEHIMSLNFNSDKVGERPLGFDDVISQNKEEITVANPKNDGDLSVKFESTSFSNAVLHKVIGNALFEEKYTAVLEFEVMMEKYGSGSGFFGPYSYTSTNNPVFYVKITENGDMVSSDGVVLTKLMCGKFYKIALCINFKEHTVDTYLNHKLIRENSYIAENLSGMGFLRFSMDKMENDGNNPIYYFDNPSLYFSDEPEFIKNRGKDATLTSSSGASAMEKYMNGTLCFYVNQDTYAKNGVVEKFDEENENIKTLIFAGTSYTVLEILCRELSLTYVEENNAIIINGNGKTLTLSSGEYKEHEELFYVPVRKVAEFFGKKVSYDKSGLIVIGERDKYFTLDMSDIAYFRELTYKMCCDEPSEDEVYTDIIEAQPSRPRILLNQSLLENLKNNLNTNATMKKWYDSIKKKMERNLTAVLPAYSGDEASFLGTAQNARSRIPQLALIYLVDGDEAYAKRAVDEMVAMAEFKDWHPKFALATAEMNFAMGCGYDWLYNYMDKKGMTAQKDKIRQAIIDKGLRVVLEDYTGDYSYTGGRGGSTKFTTLGENPHNWVYVANGGAISGAVALCDEETELCSKIISYGLENWGKAMRYLAPDGAWYEGPMYTNWMIQCTTHAMSSLENALGTHYGLMDMPGLTEVPYFIMECASYTQPFNFGNVDPIFGNINASTAFFMANHSGDTTLAQLRTYIMEKFNLGASVYDLLYAKPEYFIPAAPSVKDRVFTTPGKYSMLTMRTSATDDISVNIATVAGKSEVFEHADKGSVIIDAYGTRFINDMGKGEYGGKADWFYEYKARAEGHNVFVFNPDKSSGMVEGAVSTIEKFESNESQSIAVLNLSPHYKGNADSVKRGIKLYEGRDRIIIQDEVKSEAPIADAYWFMHTPCDITISNDGKTAKLRGGLKDMYIRLVCDDADARFTVMDAEPMATSPENTGVSNPEHKKLTIHTQNKTDINYMVCMDFEYPYVEFNKPLPQKVSLDMWKVEAENTVKPQLDNILIGGTPFKEFKKDRYSYLVTLPSGTIAPKFTAEGEGEIEVINTDKIPGTARIKITDKNGNTSEYGIVLEYIKEIVRPETPINSHDKCALPVYIVNASQILEVANVPENVLDGDKKTRWVASGEQYIEFDLGKVQPVVAVGMSIYSVLADGRQQIFDILLSEDGINWTPVIENGKTSGRSEDEEMFSFNETKAMYVRVQYYGNTINNYDSITEIRVFGKK